MAPVKLLLPQAGKSRYRRKGMIPDLDDTPFAIGYCFNVTYFSSFKVNI